MPPLLIAATLVLLFSLAVSAQTNFPPNAGAVADPCTNGVLSMSLRASRSPGLMKRPIDPDTVPIWNGLIQIRLKNVGTLIVRTVERADQYELAVLDASGKPVPMTEFGKERLPQSNVPRDPPSIGRVEFIDLAPAEELETDMYVSHYFKIEPGQSYSIKISRTLGLPAVDQVGKPISHPELSCSLSVPAGPLVELR